MLEVTDINALLQTLLQHVRSELASPWFYYQLALIVGLGLISRGLGAMLGKLADVDGRMAGWPTVLRLAMRALTANIGVAIFIILLFAARLTMVALTWPSRSYLVNVALSLAYVWFLIRLIASTVRSTFIVRLVALLAWIAVALHLVGLFDTSVELLDSVAISVGQVRISPLLVIKSALILAALLWIANIISNFLELHTARIAELTPSARVLLNKLVRLAAYTLAILVAMSAVGIDLTALAFFSGAIGVGLGFGLQKIVGNFVSGVILLADKSIKPGDFITVGENYGRVAVMNTRYISLAAPDGREFLIPNEDLITQQVTNYTYSDTRTALNVTFGVSYEADPKQVRELVVETLKNVPRVLSVKPPVCLFTAFGESSLDFTVYFWIEDPDQGLGNVRSEVMFALWYAFKQAGIDIPFPIRDVRLSGAVAAPQADIAPPARAPKPEEK